MGVRVGIQFISAIASDQHPLTMEGGIAGSTEYC